MLAYIIHKSDDATQMEINSDVPGPKYTVDHFDKTETVEINLGKTECSSCEVSPNKENAGQRSSHEIIPISTANSGFLVSSSVQELISDKRSTSSSNVSVGTSKTLSCHKQNETHDFRLQLYIFLGVCALFIVWAALYFPLTSRFG